MAPRVFTKSASQTQQPCAYVEPIRWISHCIDNLPTRVAISTVSRDQVGSTYSCARVSGSECRFVDLTAITRDTAVVDGGVTAPTTAAAAATGSIYHGTDDDELIPLGSRRCTAKVDWKKP